MRELRDTIESIEEILVAAPMAPRSTGELAAINYLRGPQVIKSEDTFWSAMSSSTSATLRRSRGRRAGPDFLNRKLKAVTQYPRRSQLQVYRQLREPSACRKETPESSCQSPLRSADSLFQFKRVSQPLSFRHPLRLVRRLHPYLALRAALVWT